jgi:polysaccharide biosynthesis protein PslH
MRSRRRILVISPWLPEPPFWGSAIRVRELVRGLSRRHAVTLVAYARPWEEQNLPAVRSLCESVHMVAATWPEGPDRLGRLKSLLYREPHSFRRLAGPAMQATVDQLLAHGEYDLVQVESSQISGLDLSRARATILDEHNIEYELLARSLRFERSLPRRAFGLVEYLKVRQAERRAWRAFDACVLTSEREVPEVRAVTSDRPVVAVPNGVDLDYFAPQRGIPTAGLVFTGLMRYRPNIDAVKYFVTEVLPLIHQTRPDVTLTIVGWGINDEIRALLGPRVVATDLVPDVRPYLAGAAVVVAPIRMAGGTRLKALEALAMAKPLVSTSQACEGLDLINGRHLLIADDPRRFADGVLRVLADPTYGEQLGETGRSRVAARYGWDSSTKRLEELHERVLTATSGIRFGATVITPAAQEAKT